MLTMEELLVIHQLREQGESITEIARRTGLDRKTVRKYLSQGLERPRYGPRAPRPRVIDPYGTTARACPGRNVMIFRIGTGQAKFGERPRRRRPGHAARDRR